MFLFIQRTVRTVKGNLMMYPFGIDLFNNNNNDNIYNNECMCVSTAMHLMYMLYIILQILGIVIFLCDSSCFIIYWAEHT